MVKKKNSLQARVSFKLGPFSIGLKVVSFRQLLDKSIVLRTVRDKYFHVSRNALMVTRNKSQRGIDFSIRMIDSGFRKNSFPNHLVQQYSKNSNKILVSDRFFGTKVNVQSPNSVVDVV